MRILITGDFHIGLNENNIAFDRYDETRKILNQIIEIIVLNKIDFLFLTGDIFHRSRPTPRAINIFVWFLHELKIRDIKIFGIEGNHDYFTNNDSIFDIFDQYGSFARKGKCITFDEFLFIPFGVDNLDSILEENRCKYIIGHFNIAGAIVGNESIFISKKVSCIHNFSTNTKKVFCGHIHKSQNFNVGSVSVCYPGSIFCNDFAERNDQKNVIIFDTEIDKILSVPLNVVKFLQIELFEDEIESFDFGVVENCVCKFIVKDNTNRYSDLQICDMLYNNACCYVFSIAREKQQKKINNIKQTNNLNEIVVEYFSKYSNPNFPLSYLHRAKDIFYK